MSVVDSLNEANDSPSQDAAQTNTLYGKSLQQARKQKNYSVAEIAKALHVTPELIEALESSATEGLPPPTFVQGYLRAYARMVDVSVVQVIQDFAVAVPHDGESELAARSNIPKQASSHSPVVKLFTMVLIVIAIAAVLYAIYSYYHDKVNDFAKHELFGSAAQTDEAGSLRLNIREQADSDAIADTELNDSASAVAEFATAEPATNGSLVGEPVTKAATVLPQQQTTYSSLAESLQPPKPTPEPVVQAASEETVVEKVEPHAVLPKDDKLIIFADKDSWVEITDAAGSSLFYSLLRAGQERKLNGAAPFDIFIGNAPDVSLRINDVDIEMTKFTRSNNIAEFRVSASNDRAVFHSR